MRYFFDSSALVKLYHREIGSAAIEEIFHGEIPTFITISSLSIAEVASALNRIKNRGEMSRTQMFPNLSSNLSVF